MACGGQGLVFRVVGSVFRIWGLGLRVQGPGFRAACPFMALANLAGAPFVTSLIRNCLPLGPYSRPIPMALWWSQGVAVSYERGTLAKEALRQGRRRARSWPSPISLVQG